MLPPLTAALGALGTVLGCALYTLLVLPESLTPEAKAAVRLGKRPQQNECFNCGLRLLGSPLGLPGQQGGLAMLRGGDNVKLLATHPQAQRRHREQQHSQRQGGSSAMHPALGSTLRAVRILMRSPLFKRLTVTMMITGEQLVQASDVAHTEPGFREALEHCSQAVPLDSHVCVGVQSRCPLTHMACWRPCPAGVVLEGLQDLLVQYLQLKLDFGVADVVRSVVSHCGRLLVLVTSWAVGCTSLLGTNRHCWLLRGASAPPRSAGMHWEGCHVHATPTLIT